jgi:alkanesulfonate monooxygenase SsuD/methylene tetrahydromethanopterin reductase-like flavin-dependent oxidoreductase (luciferase family)
MSVDFGIRLPNSGPFASPDNMVAVASKAEELGYTSAWVHDHVTWGYEMRTHFAAGAIEAVADQAPDFLESMTSAAIIGARFPRLRVGIAGLILPLRDPRILAKQIATVDRFLGPGRFTVAMGIGAMEPDFAVMQVPKTKRGKIANDYIAALNALLRSPQPVSYAGEFVAFENATFLPQPVDAPLWIAGRSEAAQRRAARHADGWLASPGAGGSLETFGGLVSRLKEILADEDRTFDDFTLGLEIFVCVGSTTDEARTIAAKSLEERFGSVERGMAATLTGDPARVAELLNGYLALGPSSIEFKFIAHDMPQLLAMTERMTEAISLTGQPLSAGPSPAP